MKIANRKIAIMLVSMVSLPIIQSTNLNAAPSGLSTEERVNLEQLVAQASAHAAHLSKQLHSFFDTKGNKESYKAHVLKFKEILDSVDANIVTPLDKVTKETANPEYKALLIEMMAIVMELREQLVYAHKTFKSNEGRGFLAVSTALSDLKENVGNRLPSLEQKLKVFHANMLDIDADLAMAIDNLTKSLPKIFEIKLSNLVVITRVKQRLEY